MSEEDRLDTNDGDADRPNTPEAPRTGGQPMSFLEKARQKAEQAAQQAREAAIQAREVAGEQAKAATAAINRGGERLADPATAAKARDTLKRARRGVATAIDRIDPGVLADIVIKATALQERANGSLRAKGSVYRINEVVIGASFPPSVSFSIARIGEIDEVPTGLEVASTELAAAVATTDGSIQALDGTTIDEDALLGEDGGEAPLG